MSDKIKEGDVVELKSGGPEMTVSHRVTGGWLCIWFDNQNIKQEGIYKEEVLDKVED